MKLTIEHLAAYLPYGLKCLDLKTEPDSNIFTLESASIHRVVSDSEGNFDIGFEEIKPILRSLSDLTKEIEHNREKFVPIERLLKERECDAEYEFIEAIEDDWASAESKFEFAPYSIIKKLHSWHFDTKGLIEAGLAINYNELNK